jgi:hypothetical protein
MTRRRRFLSFGALVVGASGLQWMTTSRKAKKTESAKNEPSAADRGFANLKSLLGGTSEWVRSVTAEDGVVELHCGIRDFSALSACVGQFADKGQRVRVLGNVLSFRAEGQAVRVVLHSELAKI